MKTIIRNLLLLAMVGAVGCMCLCHRAFAQNSIPISPPRNFQPHFYQTSQDVGHCPSGHRELKNVPIRYGTAVFTNASEEARYEQAIKNFEFYPGGCVMMDPGSPKWKVTCIKCGYRYDQEIDEPSWSRSDPDPKTFNPPLSDSVARFPSFAPAAGTKPVYGHTLRNHKVTNEEISWETNLDRYACVEALRTFCKQQQASLDLPPPPPALFKVEDWVCFIGEWSGKEISVSLFLNRNRGIVRIAFRLRHSALYKP